MWALLLPLLAQLPGIFGSMFRSQNELMKAKTTADLQIQLSKIGLAGEIARAQMAEESVIVKSTGKRFKYFTFFMWFGPFILGMVAPHYSKIIFDNLGAMPEWYVQSCMLIMFTVWGISVSADTVGGIFSSLGSFFAAKRSHALELAKVNRAQYYNALRELKGKVTPEDVRTGEKILDAMDQDDQTNGS